MSLEERLEKLITPALNDLGYDLVQLLIVGSKSVKLELIIERLDGQSVAVDDCVKASREVSALLDVEDPIESSYVLEVSSPGIERPLVKKADFERFVGHLIQVQTHTPILGRKKFLGILKGSSPDGVELSLMEPEGELCVLAFDEIHRAKLKPQASEY